MKIIKIGSIIVLFVFLIISYASLSSFDNSQNFSIDTLDDVYGIDVDVDNVNINIVTTSKDQIQVIYESSIGREEESPVFYYFDDNTFKIRQNDYEHSLIDYQANLTVYLPESISISNVEINSINSNISIEGMTLSDIIVYGDNVNLDINNTSAKDCQVYGEDINLAISNSKLDSLDERVSTGNVLLMNTTFNKDILISFEENGNIDFSKTSAEYISFEGNLKVDMTLNILVNYDIIIDRDINNDNFLKTTTGYKYTGDVDLVDDIVIDFNDSTLDKISISLE